MENEIKALQSRGFGRYRTRQLELTECRGTERLGKWLHLLVHNAMRLGLASSPDEAVCVIEPNTVFELLLGRSALTCVEDGRLTMWVDALDGADDRGRQAALVEVFNQLGLRCRGRDVVIHLREMAQG